MHFVTLTENLRSEDIEQSNNTMKGAIDLDEQIRQLLISEDLSEPDRTFLHFETKQLVEAYVKQQVSEALEKVKEAHLATFGRHGVMKGRLTSFEEDIIDDVNELLSQYTTNKERVNRDE